MNEVPAEQRIYAVLAAIPCGSVATYGQVGKLAGLSRGGRLVGRTLRNLPADSSLPWHNASGKISLPADSDSFKRQKARLQEEGLLVNGNRISLRQYQWQP